MSHPATTTLFQIDGAEVTHHAKPLTFDQPVGDLPIVDDARWSASFTDHSVAALLVWVILLIILQVVAWPLVKRIFSRLPDKGWAFGRLTTMLIAGYGVWLLASIELISFRAIWAALAVLGVGILSWFASRKIDIEDEDSPFWKNPVVIGAEVVFWSVFTLFLLYRAINPDSYHPIWGGEKPMEFAHLNAILRSAHFPPVDPWYSGGYINYYYYGTYLVALLVKLTGIPAEIAFNLAQPMFPALLASAAFSIAAALGKRLTNSTPGAVFTGCLGAFFIQFAGNFIDAARILDRAVTGSAINDFPYWVFDPTRAIPDGTGAHSNITEFPYFGGLYADLHPHVIAMPFTLLVMALAWQISTQWRLLPMIFVRRRMDTQEAFGMLTPLFLLGLALGSIFMINAWDLPMYTAVGAIGIILATQGVPHIRKRLGLVAATIGIVGILAWLLILPFTLHYVALFGEIAIVRDRTPLLAIESHIGGQILLVTMGMAALAMSRTQRRRSHVTIHALGSTVLLAGFLLVQWYGHENTNSLERPGQIGVVVVVVSIWVSSAWIVTTPRSDFKAHPLVLKTILVQTMALSTVLVTLDRLVLGLYLGIGLAAAVLWFALQRPSSRFVAMLIAGAMLLGASLELVYLVDDLSGTQWYRMNTIFKFYNQIWNLLGIATAVLAGYTIWETLVTTAVETPEPMPDPRRISTGSTAWAWICAALVLPIALASFAYPVVATPIRLDQRWEDRDGLTLNAYTWMETARLALRPSGAVTYSDDLAAINWLNENVEGTPVIAEAAFGTYRCNGSRFSIATGLPAPVGWVRHESQQRYPDDLAKRENDLRTLYTTTSVEDKMQIIDRYGIEYVIVGQTEEHYPTIDGNDCIDTGSPQGIDALESMVGTTLEVAFQHGTTTIYRVVGK